LELCHEIIRFKRSKQMREEIFKNTQAMFSALTDEGRIYQPGIMTHIPGVDAYTNGLKPNSTYCFAGLEKSGKSTFLLNLVSNWLVSGNQVGYIATELNEAFYYQSITAIVKASLPKITDSHLKTLLNRFYLIGPDNSKPQESILKDDLYDLDLILNRVERMAFEGCKVIIVDNLTVFKNQSADDWKALKVACQRLISLTRSLKAPVTVLATVHLNNSKLIHNPKFVDVKKLVNQGRAEELFTEPSQVVMRPSTADIYGGSAIKSQFDGVFLFWRPYQMFTRSELRSMTALIIDSFRGDPIVQKNSIKLRLDC